MILQDILDMQLFKNLVQLFIQASLATKWKITKLPYLPLVLLGAEVWNQDTTVVWKSVHESRFLSRVFYGTRHWFCSHRTRYHCTGAPNGLCRHHSPFAAHPCANLLGLVTDCCGWSKPLRQWLLPVSIRLVFSISSDSALPILFMLMNTDFKLAEANICLGYLFQIHE